MSAHKVVALVVVVTLNIAFVWASFRTVPVASATDPGTIAYVQRSTHDIHLISPDGANDHVLWTAPEPLSVWPAYDLAWRPDGRELAFSSEHEETCSYYQSDVYAIGYDGTGYRRVTNAPACAALAALPKGSVEVYVANSADPNAMVYVQGAPGAKFAESGTMRFDNVADFGPGVLQHAIGIYIGAYGEERTEGHPPYADVQPNQTVSGGSLDIPGISGVELFGTGKVSWNANGSALAYGMRISSRISQIPASPPYGSFGEALPVVEHAAPNLVAWGPTTATKDQYLYSSKHDLIVENIEGIYLNTVGNASGGTQLVPISAYYGGEEVYDIEWLPDASGFLFTKRYVNLGIFTDIFEYNFATEEITQLTYLPDDEGARGFSISPDGQQIVFEWVTEVWDPTSSLWIINRDGSNLHKLADDAGRPAWGQTPSFPAPTITNLNPSGALAGGSAFVLTVNGAGFVSDSIVRWNGTDRATTYINSTRLTASITAADIVTAGSASVTVLNPAPGGGTSNAATFQINTSNPVPAITSLNPASAIAGGPAFTLTVNGTDFMNGSVVRWNGTDRTTMYVNGTRLTASITAADIVTAGSANITVFNPAPSGGTSNAAAFQINSSNPVPAITSLNPASATASGSAFALTINGTNFVSGSVVHWNGTNRATTYVNGTRLTASIPAADIATAGSANVTVFNPAPGGGTSNIATFSIIDLADLTFKLYLPVIKR